MEDANTEYLLEVMVKGKKLDIFKARLDDWKDTIRNLLYNVYTMSALIKVIVRISVRIMVILRLSFIS